MTDTSNSMTKVRNLIIAGVAIALSIALIFSSTDFNLIPNS